MTTAALGKSFHTGKTSTRVCGRLAVGVSMRLLSTVGWIRAVLKQARSNAEAWRFMNAGSFLVLYLIFQR